MLLFGILADVVDSIVTNQVLYMARGRQRRNRGSSVIENRRLINLVVEVGCYPPPAEPLFRVLVLASRAS